MLSRLLVLDLNTTSDVVFVFLMIRRPPRSTLDRSSAASDVYKRQLLSLISFIIYGTTAFIATRQRDIKTGMIYAAILGLFDTTVGWKISMLLDANTGDIENQATRGLWIITAIIGTGVAALFGLLGSGLTRITGK